jgi:GT2 family glycosyltransferase
VSPRVVVVVVTFNGRRHLEYCLPSLLATAYDNYELLVVDNASADDSVAYVRAHFPDVEIVASTRNLGWAGGNNVGVRLALKRGADYIVLQNNDTRVDPRWLGEAVAAMEAHPRLGFVGFDVLGEYRPNDDPDASGFAALCAAWPGPVLGATAHISGCALFTRAAVFRDVGLFDERYFVFSEEDDLVMRAMAAGYERARLNVPVWHHHGGTWRAQPLRWSFMAMRNDIRCIVKNEPPPVRRARLAWLTRFVCTPRVEYDRSLSHFRRLRPSTWPVNVALLAGAFLWNLVFLPQTWSARHRDYARVAAARARVTALPATPLPEPG